jgi:hypothetical protein
MGMKTYKINPTMHLVPVDMSEPGMTLDFFDFSLALTKTQTVASVFCQ